MDEVLDVLNSNAGALSVLFSAAVTAATIGYAVLTWKLVVETRRLREVQTEPRLEITATPFDFAINIVRLRVRNVGMGPAMEVSFEPRVVSGGETAALLLKEFTVPNYFATGVAYLGPGQELWSMYSEMHVGAPDKLDVVLEFKVRYRSVFGRAYDEAIRIDMRELQGAYHLGKPNLFAIAQSLEEIQKDLGRVVAGHARIKADVFTSTDRDTEAEDRSERLARQRAARISNQPKGGDAPPSGDSPPVSPAE